MNKIARNQKPAYLQCVKISVSMPGLLFSEAQAVQIRLRKATFSDLIQHSLSRTIAEENSPTHAPAAPVPSPSI